MHSHLCLQANQLDNQSVADETVTRDETYESDGNQSTATSSACPTDSPTAKCEYTYQLHIHTLEIRVYLMK